MGINLKLKKKSESVIDLISRFEAAKGKTKRSLEPGDLYKARGVRISLCRNRPAPRKDAEAFEIRCSAVASRSYLYVQPGTDSRTWHEIGHHFVSQTVYVHRIIPAFARIVTPKGYHWHHIDLDNLNNRWSNLVMVNGKIHAEFHNIAEFNHGFTEEPHRQNEDPSISHDLFLKVSFLS